VWFILVDVAQRKVQYHEGAGPIFKPLTILAASRRANNLATPQPNLVHSFVFQQLSLYHSDSSSYLLVSVLD
jgi:hypothetical protein